MTKTLSHITKVALLAVIMLAAHVDAFAQIKLVTGFVYDLAQYNAAKGNDKVKKPVNMEGVQLKVLAYNNLNSAQNDYDGMMDYKNKGLFGTDGYLSHEDKSTDADERARFEIEVALSGALIVMYAGTDPVLVPINGQMELEIGIRVGEQLAEVQAIGQRKGIGPLDVPPPVQLGNLIVIQRTGITLSDDNITNGSRMTIMPYVINHSKNKKLVHYRTPRIYDGKEFHLTQERWRGYDNKNDTLRKYVIQGEPLMKGHNAFEWTDSVIVPNDQERFQLVADVKVEDYLGLVHEENQIEISPKNMRKPMRFLEYMVDGYFLDPKDYPERENRQMRADSTDIALTFMVGQTEIDSSDPNNQKEMERLKNELETSILDTYTKFKKLVFSSISSPDGNLASNKALARRRLSAAVQIVKSLLPPGALDIAYIEAEDAKVATWEDVAKLMEADSLVTEAKGIREIIAQYPSQDAQSMRMRSLAYYDTIRTAYLPKLRRMKVQWETERFRALSIDELMFMYNNDPDYKSGKKRFDKYEYWLLFQTLKDSTELENIYKLAYEDSKSWTASGRPWMLAANNLAAIYIGKDSADLSILAPFLDDSLKLNVKKDYGRIEVNNEALVANQAIMYMKKGGQYSKAGFLVAKLNAYAKKNYTALANTIYCLGGRYAVDENIYNYMRNETTPLNKVVMCLAKGTRQEARAALETLDAMPDAMTNPKLMYLRAIAYTRFGDEEMDKAAYALQACLDLDYDAGKREYLELAKNDGEIDEELLSQAFYSSKYCIYNGEDLDL